MSESTSSITQKWPACPSCERVCEPGATWKGANFCRGVILLRCIDDEPGLSAWELARLSGMGYNDASRGLSKLREYGAITVEAEEREAGGFRYRYWSADNPADRERFLAALRSVEALNDAS